MHLDAAPRAADDAAAGRTALEVAVVEPRTDAPPASLHSGPRVPQLRGGGSVWIRTGALIEEIRARRVEEARQSGQRVASASARFERATKSVADAKMSATIVTDTRRATE